MKKNHSSVFWKKVKFKYKLSFLNENTLEEVFSLRMSFWSGFWMLFAFAIVLVALTSWVIIHTPIRNYLPGYMDTEIRQEMISNALKADSLEQALLKQSQYIENAAAILQGISPIAPPPQPDTVDIKVEDLTTSSALVEFMHRYEEEEKYNLNALGVATTLPSGIVFYRPVQGMVSAPFNAAKKHFGVDIATSPRESVLATLRGTVVYTGFDANSGYVIQVQHHNGFVSFYKHNARLLKQTGDEVGAGDAIAIAGNTGELSSGVHLHFELWYNGKAIDPQEYIKF